MVIILGESREFFFDDYIVDTPNTTAAFTLHKPIAKEIVMELDKPWETNGTNYLNFFYDEDIKKYRLYYLGREKAPSANKHGELIRICYAESEDGMTWIKPNLKICEFDGSCDNNIILDFNTAPYYDNFCVFKDENPACPKDKRYKAVADYLHMLYSFYSEDGIHFRLGEMITKEGTFDSLNTAMWDKDAKKYRIYFRSFHKVGDFFGEDEFDKKPRELPDSEKQKRIRDIRYIESEDFESFSEQRLVRTNGVDYPMYTNCISKYDRGTDLLVGFPTRYIHRKEWTPTYDELCTKELRLERMKTSPRLGLATTDCVFMCSRDGVNFTRYNEAFFRPGAEYDGNWLYGNCYPARGFITAESDIAKDADAEISMLCHEFSSKKGVWQVRRYAIRQDGFVSLHAGEDEKTVTTKPFIFEGDKLFVNLSTSAAGYAYFEIKSKDGKTVSSHEIFGDSVKKRIHFDGDLSALSGKEVVMTVRMLDADIYSFKFEI